MRRVRLVAALLIPLTVLAVSCGKKETRTEQQTSTQQNQTVAVDDVETGKRVNTANQVEDKTDTFSPTDTIWASVKTENTPAGTRILARWVYTGGNAEQIVSEETHTTAQAGTGYTSFYAVNPAAWPAGSYEIRIGIDGEIRKVHKFEVKT